MNVRSVVVCSLPGSSRQGCEPAMSVCCSSIDTVVDTCDISTVKASHSEVGIYLTAVRSS